MILQELKQLKNVTKVIPIKITNKKFVNVKEQYFVYFKQPIDWNDLSKGFFEQRVRVGFNDYNNFNNLYIGGYMDVNWQALQRRQRLNYEIQNKYKANIIQIEYRNYGKSVLNQNSYSMKACKYLTTQQAMKDFKFILDQFKTIWKNKWIASGWSKGGLTTNQLAMYYPNCCDLFVPYVSIGKVDRQDIKLLNNTYKNIGLTCFDKKHKPIDLEQYRKTATLFQILLLENRKYFIEKWKEYIKLNGYELTKFGTDNFDLVYNSMVVDFYYLYFWQYREYDEILKKLKKLLKIKNKETKLRKSAEYWLSTDQICDWVLNAGCSNSYWYQNYFEIGYYSFWPQPLVDNILKYSNQYNKQNIWKQLFVFSQKELKKYDKDLVYKINLTPEQFKKAKRNSKELNKLEKHYQNTISNIIMVNGIEDPWYFISVNHSNKLKPSKKLFEFNLNGLSHIARINLADKHIKKEIWKLIDEILNKKEGK